MNEMNNVVYGMINYGNVDISEGAKGSYEYIKMIFRTSKQDILLLASTCRNLTGMNIIKSLAILH